jgi:hypothetical protein
MKMLLLWLLLLTLSPTVLAGPPSTSCNNSNQEGAFMYDKASRDFFFCRKYNKGWESLNQIVFILNGLLPLSGDAEGPTDNEAMTSELPEE